MDVVSGDRRSVQTRSDNLAERYGPQGPEKETIHVRKLFITASAVAVIVLSAAAASAGTVTVDTPGVDGGCVTVTQGKTTAGPGGVTQEGGQVTVGSISDCM